MFFGIPSVSVTNTLNPIIEEISINKEIIYYNTDYFRPEKSSFRFKPYPKYKGGYNTTQIGHTASYFHFAEILIDTADQLIDFLSREIVIERPDFILHSHLAVWGKIIAAKFNIPAVSLFTTFVLDEDIIRPWLRKSMTYKMANFNSVKDAVRLLLKIKLVYKKAFVSIEPNLWDVYVNKEELNISFIHEKFQPQTELLDSSYKFIGFPLTTEIEKTKKELIYISFGTVFNKDISFIKTCILVLAHLRLDSIISIGNTIHLEDLGTLPGNIKVQAFSNQKELLKKTSVFITHGGMASVHESIYSSTPMIVIPHIPEQEITAMKVEELEIGIHIPYKDFNFETLKNSLEFMIKNISRFNTNVNSFLKSVPKVPAERHADKLIDTFLMEKYFS